MGEYDFPVVPILEALGTEALWWGRPTGRGRQLRCVFHTDRKPSAWVSADGRGFQCMSCGLQGDALKLVMEVEGLDFKAAVTRCEEITGHQSGTTLSGGTGKRERLSLFD